MSFVAVLRILLAWTVSFVDKESVVATSVGGDIPLSDVELMMDDGV